MNRAFAGLLICFVVSLSACDRFQDKEIREALEARLQQEADTTIAAFYKENDHKLLWVKRNELTSNAEIFLTRLDSAHLDGLPREAYDPQALYDQATQLYENPPGDDEERARRLADLEYNFSLKFVDYADDFANGRIEVDDVHPDFYLRPVRVDPISALYELSQQNDPDAALDVVARTENGAAGLRNALSQLYEIQRQGGWPTVDDGDVLEEGDEGERVRQLRRRLAVTEEVEDTASRIFDADLVETVKLFQLRHGIDPDGIVGPATRAALNVPVENRIEQIVVNLERLRTLPLDYGDHYLVVNIPDFHLRIIRSNDEVMTMPVIVGEVLHPTPLFADTLTYLAFSPYWNVPTSIARRDIVPNARRSSDYLARNGYEIVSSYRQDATVYEASERNLSRVEAGELFIRQQPGPNNALGRVKFMFPNEHAIYLHDTPEGHLFSREARGFSAGCIRVERPVELARYLLDPNGGWDEDRILENMDLPDERTVTLERPLPVYLLYLTAWTDSEGALNFRDDLYGHDAELKSRVDATQLAAANESAGGL